MAIELRQADANVVVDVLAEQAGAGFLDPQTYFRNLVRRANLPPRWIIELSGVWKGDPYIDARSLLMWAAARDVNPADPRMTTLGSLLTALLDDQGLERRSQVVATIVAYRLYRDPALRAQLAAQYQIPAPAAELLREEPAAALELPPEGLPEDVELQGWLRPEPELLDVGFLSTAIDRAACVCRVEREDGTKLGTGFLIADTLVLTNFHVIGGGDGKVREDLAQIRLRFGSLTGEGGAEAEGQTFGLADQDAIAEQSPVGKLDFALLRVEDAIALADGIERAPCKTDAVLDKGMGLNILQHPMGGPMKLALSGNGVTEVFRDAGLVRYVTRAAGGSSGSPCFDDNWDVVALHHAERSRAFGAVREGVLLSAIYAQAGPHLDGRQ